MSLSVIRKNINKKVNLLNKKFYFRSSNIIKIISSPKIKIWKFNRYKYEFNNSSYANCLPRVIHFICFFQNNKKIKNFVYKLHQFHKKKFTYNKKIIIKKKERSSLLIIYFKHQFFSKFFINKIKFINLLKNNFSSMKKKITEISEFFNFKNLLSFQYNFNKKETTLWVKKRIKKVECFFFFPYKILVYKKCVYILDNKNNTIFNRKNIHDIKTLKNSNHSISKNIVYFSQNKNIEFYSKILKLLRSFEKLYIYNFYRKKNLFVIITNSTNLKKKKYFYEFKNYNKNLYLDNKLRTKGKKKNNYYLIYSYYILRSNKCKYLTVDFDYNFCFLLFKNDYNFWFISGIDGFIIGEKYYKKKNLNEKIQIEKKFSLFKIKKISLNHKIEIFLNNQIENESMTIFLFNSGIFEKKIGGYLHFNKFQIKNLSCYKTKFFVNFNVIKKKLFSKGIKILSILKNFIVCANLIYSQYFIVIVDYILKKIKIKNLVLSLGISNNNKKYSSKKKGFFQNLELEKIHNEKRIKISKKINIKNVQFNSKPIEHSHRNLKKKNLQIEKKLKSLIKITKKNKNNLFKPNRFSNQFSDQKLKESFFCKFYKIKKKILFYNKYSLFSNRIGFFFSSIYKSKLFFISYKFCFYFIILKKIYEVEKKSKYKKPSFKTIMKKTDKTLNFKLNIIFKCLFLKNLTKKSFFLNRIFLKYFIYKS
jgi:hypothetical protein